MYRIDPFGLLNRVFGFGRERLIRHYRIGENVTPSGSSDFRVNDIVDLESDVTSVFGQAVLSPINIKAGRYPEKLVDGNINFVDYPDYQFPHTTIIEVNRPKVIVKTAINGQSGTRKEYISHDDFQIRLRGLIVNQVDDYPPEDGIRAIQQILNIPAAVTAECDFFEWLGIGEIIFENPSIFQIEGFSHVVGFEVSAVSDFTPEVRLREGF